MIKDSKANDIPRAGEHPVARMPWPMHVFFFFFFLVIPALVFERLPGETLLTVTNTIAQDTLFNFALLCFFYLNYYVLLPKYFFSKKYLTYIAMVILFLCIAVPLPNLIVHWIGFSHGNESVFAPANSRFHGRPMVDKGPPMLPPGGHAGAPGPGPGPGEGRSILFFVLNAFRRHLYLFFTALFFSFFLRTRAHMAKLKEDKLHAELSSLKAQINPHFLFNTLNTIYALSIKNDSGTSDAVIHLSGLMRYVTKDIHESFIGLQKELDYITNYIELQRARLGSTVNIDYTTQGDAAGLSISPLLLITYIENTFKYGVNPDVADCPVKIHIAIKDQQLTLMTYNKKLPFLIKTESTGIGLKNTAERLKNLYHQKHQLEINDSEQDYQVTLKLLLS